MAVGFTVALPEDSKVFADQEPVHDVVLVEFQLRVEDIPAIMVVGEAVRVTVMGITMAALDCVKIKSAPKSAIKTALNKMILTKDFFPIDDFLKYSFILTYIN